MMRSRIRRVLVARLCEPIFTPLYRVISSGRSFLHFRSACAADIPLEPVGSPVRVAGWVQSVRNHGGILFVLLRDHTGVLQLTASPTEQPEGG